MVVVMIVVTSGYGCGCVYDCGFANRPSTRHANMPVRTPASKTQNGTVGAFQAVLVVITHKSSPDGLTAAAITAAD